MNSRTTDETSKKQNEVSSTSEQKLKNEKKTVRTRAIFKEPKKNVERQLSGALAHLRSEARQTTRAYMANLERDIVKVTEFVHDSSPTPEGQFMKIGEGARMPSSAWSMRP